MAQPQLLTHVLINEFMPAPTPGHEEWLELYNPGESAVDISGWKIDDDTLGGSRTIIAAGTILAPGALLIVTNSASFLNNTGSDAAQLLDPNDMVIDTASYTGASVGLSYARIPDGGTIWVQGQPSAGVLNAPQASPTPTALPVLPTATIPTVTSSEPSATLSSIPSAQPSPSLSLIHI